MENKKWPLSLARQKELVILTKPIQWKGDGTLIGIGWEENGGRLVFSEFFRLQGSFPAMTC